MLTTEEAELVYKELAEIVRQVRLGYVIEQVTDEIRLGRIESKRVRVSEAAVDDYLVVGSARGSKTKTETFTKIIEFNAHEKLGLLIRALERATIEIAEMHEETATVLKDVNFKPDPQRSRAGLAAFTFTNEENAREVISDVEARSKFLVECALLRPLLSELKESLNAPEI